ncbi:MAG TPA: pyruvate kinase [Deltaproteobacteria bacterium]|jgi:pyruvate kinase|nr:pyruvate kinase [Deltaproteobacteria bacterium]
MDYRIIATIGPGSSRESVWGDMVSAGAGGFRLNTSHLTLEELDGWVRRAGAFLGPTGLPLVLDLQGGKWRLGEFPHVSLEPGRTVTLAYGRSASEPDVLPVPHLDFFQAAPASGREIVLNDAKVVLLRETCAERAITARVVQGGELSPRKGITFASCGYRIEDLGGKDRAILERTRGAAFVRYAVSYVKDAEEMARYRRAFGKGAHLIAKLERETALADAHGIASSADEMWLCRGDLGAEMGLVRMAEAIHRFTGQVPGLPVPVTLAGQVLEHMVKSPVPTRSEVCCIHDALVRGYRGLVLSDETAVGDHPVEACRAAAMFRG